MAHHEGLINNLHALEVDEPTPQYILPPNEFDAYADRWDDILSNPPAPTKPTRPSAPAPTPVERPSVQQLKSTASVGGNNLKKSQSYKKQNRALRSPVSYQPQFDDKELDYRLYCLAREKRLLYGAAPEDHQLLSKFDIFEEFQSYFLPDDNYIWNENRRASRLCDQVTWGRLQQSPMKGVITDPQYLSFSASATYFGEGDSKPNFRSSLYSSRRLPSDAYKPPTMSGSLSMSFSPEREAKF